MGAFEDPVEDRSEIEGRFLDRLRESVADIFDVWLFYPQLVVTLCVCDPDDQVVLRTLRVDFDGLRIVAGNDPSHQITEERLDPEDPDLFQLPAGSPPEHCAEAAVDGSGSRLDDRSISTNGMGLCTWLAALGPGRHRQGPC